MAKIGSLRWNPLRKIGHDFGFINSNTQCIFNGWLFMGNSRIKSNYYCQEFIFALLHYSDCGV